MNPTPITLALAALLPIAHAQESTPRAGHTSTLTLRADISVESVTNETYSTTLSRFGNREILAQMLSSNLLDGRLSGWYLGIMGEATGNPKVYAIKKNKPVVEVPESLLTLPTINHRARKGSTANPTTAAPSSTLTQSVQSTFKVKDATVTGFGTQTLQKANFTLGTTTTAVTTWTDTLTFTGPAPSGTGTMTGFYRTRTAKRLNVTPYLGTPSTTETPDETPDETPPA